MGKVKEFMKKHKTEIILTTGAVIGTAVGVGVYRHKTADIRELVEVLKKFKDDVRCKRSQNGIFKDIATAIGDSNTGRIYCELQEFKVSDLGDQLKEAIVETGVDENSAVTGLAIFIKEVVD